MAEYIERDALLDKMEGRYKFSSGQAHKAYGIAIDDICNAPTITPESLVRHGRWIWKGEEKGWICSECESGCLLNYESDWHKSDWCPHCGSKMDLEE